MVHVPYKGSGPAMVELMGGQVKAMIETVPVYATHTTPDQAAKRISDEVALWAKVIKDANVKVE